MFQKKVLGCLENWHHFILFHLSRLVSNQQVSATSTGSFVRDSRKPQGTDCRFCREHYVANLQNLLPKCWFGRVQFHHEWRPTKQRRFQLNVANVILIILIKWFSSKIFVLLLILELSATTHPSCIPWRCRSMFFLLHLRAPSSHLHSSIVQERPSGTLRVPTNCFGDARGTVGWLVYDHDGHWEMGKQKV